ncbi:MAG: hypothetical protein AAF697_13145 [Pseudomonadota bacterium]
MKKKEFKSVIKEKFGPFAEVHGFSLAASANNLDYTRSTPSGLWHLLIFSQTSTGNYFDIMVTASSSAVDHTFAERFPSDLAIPNAPDCYLTDDLGIEDQQLFSCKTHDDLKRSWDEAVQPALIKYAFPYLDRLQNVEDYLPFLEGDGFRGEALYSLRRFEEARYFLESELAFLKGLGPNDEITRNISYYERLIEGCTGGTQSVE